MATFKRFEEMHAWQSARDLVKLVYDVTKQPDLNRDFALRDQIRRAVISVMSNIAEGFGTGTDAGFIRFLGYADEDRHLKHNHSYMQRPMCWIFQMTCKIF